MQKIGIISLEAIPESYFLIPYSQQGITYQAR
jgi:hypothetical protein